MTKDMYAKDPSFLVVRLMDSKELKEKKKNPGNPTWVEEKGCSASQRRTSPGRKGLPRALTADTGTLTSSGFHSIFSINVALLQKKLRQARSSLFLIQPKLTESIFLDQFAY